MAGVSSTRPALSTLRHLLREIRRNLPTQESKRCNQPLVNYILQEYRRHQVTSKQHCKPGQEMEHLANTYATYLTSQRMWFRVHNEYHAKGERSIAETAGIVGFKLPHDPK